MTIKQTAIDAVAKAMAHYQHAGPEELPDRDIDLYREQAKLFLAASLALEQLAPEDVEDAPASDAAPDAPPAVEPGPQE